MGESAIEKTLATAKNEQLRAALTECKNTHAVLGDRTHALLLRSGADTKDPHAVIRMMSDVKIHTSLAMRGKDSTVASLMTDGCDMGVKSLSKYLNRYKKANPEAKDIARKLIDCELALEEKLRQFL